MTDATATAANAILTVLPTDQFVSWSFVCSKTPGINPTSRHSAMRIMREDLVVEFKDGKYRKRTREEFRAA